MNKTIISDYQWKLSFGIIYLFALTLPFSLKLSNILLIVIGSLLIFRQDYLNDLRKNRYNSSLLSLIALFVIYSMSILWSNNKSHGGFILEKHLSLLLIPLAVIPALSYLKTHIRNILSCFVIGILLSFSWLFYQYLTNYKSTTDISHFFREIAVQYVQLHPSYLAMYTVFAFAIIAVRLKLYRPGLLKILAFVALLILFILTLLTGARMPLFALFVITFAMTTRVLLKFRYGWLLTLVLLVSIGFIGYFSFQTTLLKNRISEISNTAFKPPVGTHFNSVNLRIAQLLCSKEIISQHLIAGVGIGDVQDKLNTCYQQHNWSPTLYDRRYNAHNQYLQTWLSSGIPALLILLFVLLAPLLKGTNRLHVALIILFSICCLTESMLEKNKGIVFFVFFTTLLSQTFPLANNHLEKEKTGS